MRDRLSGVAEGAAAAVGFFSHRPRVVPEASLARPNRELLARYWRICASGISGRDVTAFLSRTVDVLRVLQAHHRYDDVRELTSAAAAAIERFD